MDSEMEMENRSLHNSNRRPDRKSSVNPNVLIGGTIVGIVVIIISAVAINRYLSNKEIEDLKELRELEKLMKSKDELEDELLDLYIKIDSRIGEFKVKKLVFDSIYKVMKKDIALDDTRLVEEIKSIATKNSKGFIFDSLISSINDESKTKEALLIRIEKLKKIIEDINTDISTVEEGILLMDTRITVRLGEENAIKKEGIKVLEEIEKKIKEFIDKSGIRGREIILEFIEEMNMQRGREILVDEFKDRIKKMKNEN